MKETTSRTFSVCIAIITALASGLAVKAATTNNLYLMIPGASWSLEIDVPGFTLLHRNFSDDGTAARLMAENENTGLILSAFMEKAAAAGDAKQCREYYWNAAQKSPMKKDDFKMSETGSVALAEYIVKEYRGMPVNQKNVNAYLSRHGYWFDVHISKADFKPDDEAMLQAVVKSIRFNEDFVPTTGEWATWGGFYLSKGRYAEAVRCDEKAWEQEKAKPGLARRERVFLLGDLIDAHGNLGNLKRAKELSELGLQEEPAYPKFYYDLACCHAEAGEKTPALDNLKLALQNRARLLSGDDLPDPQTDSSFTKYSSDPDFKKLVSEWKK
jgi:tetratricopeptide (TPR) repeat protein